MARNVRYKRLSNPAGSPANKPQKPGAPSTAKSDVYSSNYDFLLVNGTIDEKLANEIFLAVSQKIAAGGSPPNRGIILALITYGGLPNPAYKIGRFLQSMYDEVVCFVPSICKSAGTLIATAANKLVMSPYAEIGPLDVQLIPRDEIRGRRSGLTTRSALDVLKDQSLDLFEHFLLQITERSSGAVTFRLAADVSAKISSHLMSKIYEQINPESLGQDARDLSIATEYCTRLNERGQNLLPQGVQRLVQGYPSHDFVIDLEEAREIFRRVERPTASLYKVLQDNIHDMLKPLTGVPIVRICDGSRSDAGKDAIPNVEDRKAGRAGSTGTSDEGDSGGTASEKE